MRQVFIWAGVALCQFSLVIIARRDWLRLTLPSRRVIGRVTGHRIKRDSDGTGFSATYGFETEGGHHEVIDQVISTVRQPPEGTLVELTHPAGHPDLARPPRPLMWAAVYAFLLGLTGLLVALGLGLID
ncbi:hypothetical protein [Novosphingobium sp.]|uniref:hypothetical protein n=1 Tax=Novosphingobium sp. TaxID=1874826 RepID=UPI00286DA6D8|nr:hypothetical protein [Novosphingobium sp.]